MSVRETLADPIILKRFRRVTETLVVEIWDKETSVFFEISKREMTSIILMKLSPDRKVFEVLVFSRMELESRYSHPFTCILLSRRARINSIEVSFSLVMIESIFIFSK